MKAYNLDWQSISEMRGTNWNLPPSWDQLKSMRLEISEDDGRLINYHILFEDGSSESADEARGDKIPFTDYEIRGLKSYSQENRRHLEGIADQEKLNKVKKWGAWFIAGGAAIASAPVIGAAAAIYAIYRHAKDDS